MNGLGRPPGEFVDVETTAEGGAGFSARNAGLFNTVVGLKSLWTIGVIVLKFPLGAMMTS